MYPQNRTITEVIALIISGLKAKQSVYQGIEVSNYYRLNDVLRLLHEIEATFNFIAIDARNRLDSLPLHCAEDSMSATFVYCPAVDVILKEVALTYFEHKQFTELMERSDFPDPFAPASKKSLR